METNYYSDLYSCFNRVLANKKYININKVVNDIYDNYVYIIANSDNILKHVTYIKNGESKQITMRKHLRYKKKNYNYNNMEREFKILRTNYLEFYCVIFMVSPVSPYRPYVKKLTGDLTLKYVKNCSDNCSQTNYECSNNLDADQYMDLINKYPSRTSIMFLRNILGNDPILDYVNYDVLYKDIEHDLLLLINYICTGNWNKKGSRSKARKLREKLYCFIETTFCAEMSKISYEYLEELYNDSC
jgi:hypothetical protein